MLTLQMTAGNNSDSIWMLKINTPTLSYLSTRDISLDNTWDGQVLNFGNYLSDLTQSSSIQSSGGTGSVSSMNFSISRYVGNTNFDIFFNDWYPATGKGYLSGQLVDFGICWIGATTDTEITWLFRGRIVDYSYEQRKLNITVFQESEISNKEIPYYAVQKGVDNGVSYFPSAPDENVGKTLPIVYGDFDNTSVDFWGRAKVTPALIVDESDITVIGASHKAFSSGYHVFLYESGISSFAYITSGNNSTINKYYSHGITLQSSPTQLLGEMYIKLSQSTLSGDIMQVDNLINEDLTDYIELDAGEYLALKMNGSPSNSIGTPGLGLGGTPANGDIEICFYLSSDGVNNRTAYVGMINPSINSVIYTEYAPGVISTGTTPILRSTNISNTTANKASPTLPWQLSEIGELDFVVRNAQATPGEKVLVYFGFLHLSNIKIKSVSNRVPVSSGTFTVNYNFQG